MKSSAISLTEFCFGQEITENTAYIRNDYHQAINHYLTLAKDDVTIFVADICVIKCVPWWKKNRVNLQSIALFAAGDNVFQSQQVAVEYCKKEYQNWLSSKLINLWSGLSFRIMEFRANSLETFCYGHKPDASLNYKSTVKSLIGAAKIDITNGMKKPSEALDDFITNICTNKCVPIGWNVVQQSHYRHDSDRESWKNVHLQI